MWHCVDALWSVWDWLTGVAVAGLTEHARGAQTGGRSVEAEQTGSICSFTQLQRQEAEAYVERLATTMAASSVATRFMRFPFALWLRQSSNKQ